MTTLLIAAAVGCALVAGIFYTFSTFVMRALGRLSPGAGIEAMQSINIVVINPLTMGAMFGTGAIALTTSVVGHGTPLLHLATALYLFGCLGVTIGGNVPLNEALATVTPGEAGADEHWRRYLVRWTRWNHVRTLASLSGSVVYAIALGGA